MVKRQFSREFKLQVVRQLVSGGKRFAQLCREHGRCQTLLRRLREQFVYLATLMDAFSRRVVGWCLSGEIDRPLVLTALERALAARQPPAAWIHHSDQGVQYVCGAYTERLLAAGAQISMAAKGTPLENAQAERFFRTLKPEEVYLHEYQTFAEAETSIGRFIDDVYNQKRLHSALGYRPPSEFEPLYLNGTL